MVAQEPPSHSKHRVEAIATREGVAIPASQGRIAGYRIGRDQSADIRAVAHTATLPVHPPLRHFCASLICTTSAPPFASVRQMKTFVIDRRRRTDRRASYLL